MKVKEFKGLELYDLSFSEETALSMQDFSVQKNLIQIPTYMIVNKPLDWKLMEKAVDIEIQRNDCLRLRLIKVHGKVKQYFLPEYHLSSIPFDDFAGKKREYMLASLKEDAAEPVRFFKGEVFRVRFFRSWDGRDGIYTNICHVNMDLASVLLFYKDLFSVYFALSEGKDLPKPLYSYKDSLMKELEDKTDPKKLERGEKFFTEFYASRQPTFYAGIDGMRQLNAIRKRKKKSDHRYVSAIDPLHYKSNTKAVTVDGETVEKWQSFSNEIGMPLQSLLYLGYRTYLSKINEKTEDVSFNVIFNRRATIRDLNCGGCRMLPQPWSTIIKPDTSFIDALTYCAEMQVKFMRHADYPLFLSDKVRNKAYNRPVGSVGASMLLSVIPPLSFPLPEGWSCEFGGMSSGYFPYFAYTMIVPNFIGSGLTCFYEYRASRFTEQEVRAMHNGMLKTLELGMNDPTITIDEIMHQLS